jgi:cbb3-type cytochrome oxidase maturation protein
MTVLYLILPLALLFAGAAVAAFAWTVRSGQLDDIDTPPRRILFEDEPLGRSPAPASRATPVKRELGQPANAVGGDRPGQQRADLAVTPASGAGPARSAALQAAIAGTARE